MVRKEFVRPELEIVKLESNDIIATSGGTGGSTGGGAWGARALEDFDVIDGDFEIIDGDFE